MLPLPTSTTSILHGRTVEWERLEFKCGWNPQDVLHTICAFANDFRNLGGGYIVIGVEERDGQAILPPVGIDLDCVDTIQKEMLNMGNSCMQPQYHPLTYPCEVDGKWILIIWAPGGETRPYKTKISMSERKADWGYYIRRQSSTVRAKGRDEKELLSLAATVPFDDRYNQQATLDDLSLPLIQRFLQAAGSALADETEQLSMEELGRRMNIVGGPPEKPFPKNIGLLFFNEQPEQFFPATQIDVVWFPEGPGGDQFTEKEFKGPIDQILRESLEYIRRNYIQEVVIKHADRAEATRVHNFPFSAIEEALANAVYHRSYEEREPIEVRISREELIVLSYPGPDRSVRLQELQQGQAHSRRYRNRRVGEFLKELDITEGRGTGIPKMIKAMDKNGSPAPLFEFDEDYSYFKLSLGAHPESLKTAGVDIGTDDKRVIASPDMQIGTKPALSRHQVTMLRKCLIDSDIKTLMKIAKRKDRSKFRHQVLNPLLKSGLLIMTVPEKPTSPLQKYQLTSLGRQILEDL